MHDWTKILGELMEKRGMNPRQLSLRAGLNPTAVRDIMAGRAKFPRYDTVRALANALDTTPAYLMGDLDTRQAFHQGTIGTPKELELLTEIIARVQETATSMNRPISPKELAVVSSAIFSELVNNKTKNGNKKEIEQQTKTILSCYDSLQKRQS